MANLGARYTVETSEKWQDEWYLSLKDTRNLFDYFKSCSEGNCAGIFQFDPDVARVKFKHWNNTKFRAGMEQIQQPDSEGDRHIIFYPRNWVFVVNFFKWNGEKNNNDVAIGAIKIALESPPAALQDFSTRYYRILQQKGVPVDSLPQPADSLTPYPFPPSPGLTSPGLSTFEPPVRLSKKEILPKPELPTIEANLWKRIWLHVGAIPKWPETEAKSCSKAAMFVRDFPDLDHVKIARAMEHWHSENPRMLPSLRRWGNFVRNEDRWQKEEQAAQPTMPLVPPPEDNSKKERALFQIRGALKRGAWDKADPAWKKLMLDNAGIKDPQEALK